MYKLQILILTLPNLAFNAFIKSKYFLNKPSISPDDNNPRIFKISFPPTEINKKVFVLLKS